MKIEVFKTDVTNKVQAYFLLQIIQRIFEYEVNFDLDDCDRILRAKSTTGDVSASGIIQLLNDFGVSAAVLPDEIDENTTALARNPIHTSY